MWLDHEMVGMATMRGYNNATSREYKLIYDPAQHTIYMKLFPQLWHEV